MNQIWIDLPWPPSVNAYYGRNKFGSTYVRREGKAYKERVKQCVSEWWTCSSHVVGERFPEPALITGPAYCYTLLKPPTRRSVDIDNRDKALFDAMEYAGLIEDDKLIRCRKTMFGDIVKGGQVRVFLMEESITEQQGEDWFNSLIVGNS